MGENIYLEEIENTYIIIDDNFDDLYAKCADDQERNKLTTTRDSAKQALWQAVSSQLQTNSSSIQQAFNDLQKTNISLKKSLDDLKSISTM